MSNAVEQASPREYNVTSLDFAIRDMPILSDTHPAPINPPQPAASG